MNFVKCPCCAGHETISAEAAAELAMMIFNRLDGFGEGPVVTELNNIRNTILNMQERETIRPEEVLPLCPTPQKRKYSNFAHVKPFAAKWRQHPYRCECGYWHLSKQTPDEHAAKINSPAADANEFPAIDPLLT